ncbi:hypothetical protein JTB14_027523 [Gonioctena quinquepunctata]|nr:hypothetical protein JTB14_027523 [Gonioctena quinquepunctata]
MVMEHFAFICIFGIWLATSISAQICTQPSLLHPEPEYVYFVNGSLLEAVAAFSGDSVDEESCYEKEGYVYKLNEEPLTKYVVLFEGEMALAFSLARDDKLHLPNHQIMPPDDIIDKFKMKLKSQLQGPLRCGNVSLTDIFPTLLNETNIVFDYMERDCEIQLLQSIPIHKNEDEISHPVAEPLTSYFYYEDYFSILYIFALISVAASLVNVIVNFTILRKAKGNGMHLCYGIFFLLSHYVRYTEISRETKMYLQK